MSAQHPLMEFGSPCSCHRHGGSGVPVGQQPLLPGGPLVTCLPRVPLVLFAHYHGLSHLHTRLWQQLKAMSANRSWGWRRSRSSPSRRPCGSCPTSCPSPWVRPRQPTLARCACCPGVEGRACISVAQEVADCLHAHMPWAGHSDGITDESLHATVSCAAVCVPHSFLQEAVFPDRSIVLPVHGSAVARWSAQRGGLGQWPGAVVGRQPERPAGAGGCGGAECANADAHSQRFWRAREGVLSHYECQCHACCAD